MNNIERGQLNNTYGAAPKDSSLSESKKSKIADKVYQDDFVEKKSEGNSEDFERIEITQRLASFIDLPRVEILEENEDSFTVRLGDEKFDIIKSDDTYFNHDLNMYHSGKIALRMTQRTISMGNIHLDKETPQDFMEVLMFHELREKEYQESGFEDAHNRAVNDEILYVMKYLPKETAMAYFDFAEKLRSEAKAKKMEQEDEERKRFEQKEVEKKLAKEQEERFNILKEKASVDLGIPKDHQTLKRGKWYNTEHLNITAIWIKDYLSDKNDNFYLAPISEERLERFRRDFGDGWAYDSFKKLAEEVNSLCNKSEPSEDYKGLCDVKIEKEDAEVLLAKIGAFLELFRKK